jgi:hypothetical protein
MGVDFVSSQLLNESFGFVQGQELGYADANEGGFLLYEEVSGYYTNLPSNITDRVLELSVDFCDDRAHVLQLGKHIFLRPCFPSHHGGHLRGSISLRGTDMTVERTWLIIGPKRDPRLLSFPRAFSRTVGKDKNRRVWPVGAVSNTMTEYSIDFTCL